MSKKVKLQKGFVSGHSTDSRNLSLRDTSKPNKLIITRVAKAKRQKSGT